MKEILGCIRRADQDYHMIESGDRVAVGVSGGKDSVLLLYALSLYRRFSPHPFELEAVTLTTGLVRSWPHPRAVRENRRALHRARNGNRPHRL